MALFEGCVHVLSASQSTSEPLSRDISNLSLDAADTTSNLDNIHGLFAAPEAHTEAQRSAHKRRKLHHDGGSLNEAQPDDHQSVVLANVSLQLVRAVRRCCNNWLMWTRASLRLRMSRYMKVVRQMEHPCLRRSHCLWSTLKRLIRTLFVPSSTIQILGVVPLSPPPLSKTSSIR
jgi:hypothetical protein